MNHHASKRRRSLPPGERLFHLINITVMLFLMAITLYPMLYVLFASLSEPLALSRVRGPLLAPQGFSLRGYEAVFSLRQFWTTYRNTLFYVALGTVINMTLTILGAYVLSFRGFLLRAPFLFMVLFTMYFSGGMIPTYLVVKQLGLTDTVWAILIPGCISVYNLIVLRTSFQAIPTSLYESANIDGANHIVLLTHIVLPLSKAALATITLFYAVGRWGDWYNAMVYLGNSPNLYPLQMYLRQILVEETNIDTITGGFSTESAEYYLLRRVIKYAAVVASTVPILLVYPFLQKHFTKGVMLGSIKG